MPPIRQPDSQVAEHGFRHVVTNLVGGNESGIHVEAHALDVRAGERLLLYSNGLTEKVADDVIAAVLERELDSEAAATKLVALANDVGGRAGHAILSLDLIGIEGLGFCGAPRDDQGDHKGRSQPGNHRGRLALILRHSSFFLY